MTPRRKPRNKAVFAIAGRALLVAMAVLWAAGVASCGSRRPKEPFSITDNQTRFSIEVNGRTREGKLHVPLVYDGTKPYSLLFALHGGGQTPDFFSGMGFNRLADALDFIVVYPEGVARRWDSPDDADFFRAMVREFKAKYAIDPARVYATGHSAGAFEVYELAILAPGLFSAIAPVAGAVMADAPRTGLHPVSVLHIHTKDDPEVPFEGVREWNFLSVRGSDDFWRAANGGFGIPVPDSVPVPRGPYERAAETAYDAHGIKGVLWRGKEADTESLVYNRGGHVWPPLATETIMDFFYNHPARGARIAIDGEALPICAARGSTIPLKARVDPARAVKSVAFFSNTTLLAEVTKPPFVTAWKVSTEGPNVLRAEARLDSGETIKSTLDPFVLATAPIAGKTAASPSTATLIPVIAASSSGNEDSNLEPPCAIDNDFYTRWGSEWTDDQTLTLDLGEPHRVNGVTIFWEIAWGKEYCIELSSDGRSWQRAVRQDDGKGGVESYAFPPTRARYVRFSGGKRGTEWGYSFWEMLVHGE